MNEPFHRRIAGWRGLLPGIALLLCGVMAAEIVLSVRRQSQTWDEAYHLYAGYRYLQAADFGINSEHPPLVKLLAALPLIPLQLKVPRVPPGSSKREGFTTARKFLYSNAADALLLRARLAAGLLTVLLSLIVFEAARRMFGPGGAILAMGLVAFEPNLLGHGALVTTDAALTCCLFAAVYAFYRYIKRPNKRRLVECGVVAGITLAAKHSGVLVFPVLGLLAIAEAGLAARLRPESLTTKRERVTLALRRGARLASDLAVMALVAFAVLWAFYGFRFPARPGTLQMTPPLAAYVSGGNGPGVSNPLFARAILALHGAHLLPESYLYGFSDVLRVSEGHRPAFLFGRLYPEGQWFYFPAALAIKTTLGFVLLLVLAGFLVRYFRTEKLREGLYMILPAVVYTAVSLTSRLNVGVRHLLPVYPFLAILAGAAAWELLGRSRRWGYLVALGLGLHAASSLRAFPDYLAYSNEIWGGPQGTYRVLADSNADSGQGLIAARNFLERERIVDCWLAYFGSADPGYYNLPCKLLPDNYSVWWEAPAEIAPDNLQGTLLIGATEAAGVYWGPAELNPYGQFLTLPPAEVLGGSLLVFKGRFQLPAAAARARLDSIWRLRLPGQTDEALAEADAAVNLAPQMVYARYARAYLLAMKNEKVQARKEYETALHLARTIHPEYQWYWVPFLENLIHGLN